MNSKLNFKENDYRKGFVFRDSINKSLETALNSDKYVIIHGQSGNGKSTIAAQYAYKKLKKYKNLTVRWIDCSCMTNILVDLKIFANDLDSFEEKNNRENSTNLNDSINESKNFIQSFKEKINKDYSKVEKSAERAMNLMEDYKTNFDPELINDKDLLDKNPKFLFILDNVTNMKEIEEFTNGFENNSNTKFIIITTNEYIINSNIKKIIVEMFDVDESTRILKNETTNRFADFELKQIIKMFDSDNIRPFNLFNLISVVNFNKSWKIKDVQTEYFNDKFNFIKLNCSKAYDILSYLAYLDCNNISLRILQQIFISHQQDDVTEGLEFLINNKFLSQSEDKYGNSTYFIHELLQFEIIDKIELNNFNKNFILTEIITAINALLQLNSKFDENFSKIFKQANKVLDIEWYNMKKSEEYLTLFNKVVKIKKEFLFLIKSPEINLKKMIKNSDIVLDLSSFDEIDDKILDFIKKELKINRSIGNIIWKKDACLNVNQEKEKKEIEKILIENNKSFDPYPSDYTHGVLCNHVYSGSLQEDNTPTIKESIIDMWYKIQNTELKTFNDKNYTQQNLERDEQETNEKNNLFLKHLENWKVHKINFKNGFKSILYMNDTTKHLVLAFKGISFKISDLFSKEKNNIDSCIKSLLGNHELPYQCVLAYQATQEAVNLSKELGYSLSFTGYSFGAWLAEQAVFFCYNDFEKRNVKAVTFDSPGSYEILEKLIKSNVKNAKNSFKLTHLNIRTYLSEPNFINTCNSHVGEVFCFINLTTESNNEKYKSIALAEDENIFKNLKKMGENKYKNVKSKFKAYFKCIKSLFSNALTTILKEFDFTTQKVKHDKIREVLNWPKLGFTPDKKFKDNSKDLLKLSVVYGKYDPVVKASCYLAIYVLKYIVDDYFCGINSIICLIIELFKSEIGDSELLKYYEFNNNEVSSKNIEIPVQNFNLKYQANFNIKKISLHEYILKPKFGNLDYYLETYFKLKDSFTYQIDFIIMQLKEFDKLVKFEVVDCLMKISSLKEEYEIEKLIDRFRRILALDRSLEHYFDNYIYANKQVEIKNNLEIKNHLPDISFEKYLNRNKELDTLDDLLNKNQYIFIHGKSGSGKSIISFQYARKRLEKEPKSIVRWINCTYLESILSSLKVLALEFNLNTDLELKELIISLRNKLKTYSTNFTFLFILDNLTFVDDIRDLTTGFSKNLQFIITSKNEKLNDDLKLATIEIGSFTNAECSDLIKLHKIDNYRLNQLEIFLHEINNEQNLPIFIKALISAYEENSHWTINDLKKHAKNFLEQLKQNYPLAYQILKHSAFLDGDALSFKFFKCILNENPMEIKKALDFLVEKDIFTVFDIDKYSIHEWFQIEYHKMRSISDTSKSKFMDDLVKILNKLIDNEKNEIELRILIKQAIKALQIDWTNKNETFKKLIKSISDIHEDKYLGYKSAFLNYTILLEFLTDNNDNYTNITFKIAEMSYAFGDYKKALKNYLIYSNKVEQISTKNFNNSLYKCYFRTAKCYLKTNDSEKALILLEDPKILKTSLKAHLKAKIHNKIAYLQFYEMRKNEQAYSNYYKNQEMKIPYRNRYLIYDTYLNIARTQENSGKNLNAIQSYRKSLIHLKTELPNDKIKLIDILKAIANIYLEEGDYSNALKEFDDILRLQRENLSLNKKTFYLISNITGKIFMKLNDYEAALRNFKESLKFLRENLSSVYTSRIDHISIAQTHEHIAECYELKVEKTNDSVMISKFKAKALKNYINCLNILKITASINLDKNQIKKTEAKILKLQS